MASTGIRRRKREARTPLASCNTTPRYFDMSIVSNPFLRHRRRGLDAQTGRPSARIDCGRASHPTTHREPTSREDSAHNPRIPNTFGSDRSGRRQGRRRAHRAARRPHDGGEQPLLHHARRPSVPIYYVTLRIQLEEQYEFMGQLTGSRCRVVATKSVAQHVAEPQWRLWTTVFYC